MDSTLSVALRSLTRAAPLSDAELVEWARTGRSSWITDPREAQSLELRPRLEDLAWAAQRAGDNKTAVELANEAFEKYASDWNYFPMANVAAFVAPLDAEKARQMRSRIAQAIQVASTALTPDDGAKSDYFLYGAGGSLFPDDPALARLLLESEWHQLFSALSEGSMEKKPELLQALYEVRDAMGIIDVARASDLARMLSADAMSNGYFRTRLISYGFMSPAQRREYFLKRQLDSNLKIGQI